MKFSKFILVVFAFSIFCFSKAEASPRIIRDTEIETALQTWSTPVFAAAGMNSAQIDIILVESPEVNAFVAGGSNIFLYTGLLQKSKTPEEVIGVIAHELGHIAGGHLVRTRRAMEQASFESILALVLGVGVAAAGGGGEAATAGAAIGRAQGLSSFLRHSRVQESSADQAAFSYLVEAKIDPSGLVSFLEKIAAEEILPSAQQSAYMRTHPLSKQRIESLKYKLQTSKFMVNPTPQKWIEDYARMKAKLAGFVTPNQVLYLYPSSDNSIAADYARAIALYRQNKKNESISALQALIKREPQNPYFYELKGQVLYEAGRAAESLVPYKKALDILPNAGLIRTAYAQSLIDTGKFDQALTELNRAEKDEPRSSRIKRLMATAAGRLGREAEAKVYLAEEALMQNRRADALAQAQGALKNLPTSSKLRIRAQDVISLAESLNDREND